MSPADVIARSLKDLRESRPMTQKRLAEVMTELGFGWKRITVAEAESGKRGINHAELLALSMVFAVSIHRFFIIDEVETLTLSPNLSFDRKQLGAILGRDLRDPFASRPEIAATLRRLADCLDSPTAIPARAPSKLNETTGPRITVQARPLAETEGGER